MNEIEKVNILGVKAVPNSSDYVPKNDRPKATSIETTYLEPTKVSDVLAFTKPLKTELEVPEVTGKDIVDFAKNFENVKYVHGGEDPNSGLDCSGFTQLVYKKFGVELPRYSNDQRDYGKPIASIEEAQPGDLLCFNGHVGIYMGDNKMIHASSGQGKVRVQENLDLYFHDMPLKCIRRLI